MKKLTKIANINKQNQSKTTLALQGVRANTPKNEKNIKN